MAPDFGPARMWLALACDQKSMPEQAVSEWEKVVPLAQPSSVGRTGLARSYALAGRREEAQQLVEEIQQRSTPGYLEPYYLIGAYAALGDLDRAFGCLERASEERSGWLATWVVGDPRLDPLRADSRFADLLRRMGLSPVGQ